MLYSSITHLACKYATPGEVSGRCTLCGASTDTGYNMPFSEKFTQYSTLYDGDCVCQYCYAFLKEQGFRRRSWVATESTVVFLKRSELMHYLLTPPNPPFAIYITQSGQRMGWLSNIRAVSYSQQRFYILTDFVDTVFVNDIKAVHVRAKLVTQLRERKVPKGQLRTGEYSMSTYKKAMNGGWENLLDIAREYAGEQLWEVLVYVAE